MITSPGKKITDPAESFFCGIEIFAVALKLVDKLVESGFVEHVGTDSVELVETG